MIYPLDNGVIEMRLFQRLVLAALLEIVLVAPLSYAAAPKARVSGPAQVVVGETFYLDISESVYDPETPLVVSFAVPAEPVEVPKATILMDGDKASAARVLASQPGTFSVVVSATGKPDGSEKPVTEFAVLSVVVSPATPPPPPTPEPSPNPTPGPTPNPTPTPTPTPEPASPGVTLGRQFAPALADALAKGFEAAATQRAAGLTIKQADDALKSTFSSARNKAFETIVAPTMAKYLPSGAEPTPDGLNRYATFHRDFATGLREGCKP